MSRDSNRSLIKDLQAKVEDQQSTLNKFGGVLEYCVRQVETFNVGIEQAMSRLTILEKAVKPPQPEKPVNIVVPDAPGT